MQGTRQHLPTASGPSKNWLIRNRVSLFIKREVACTIMLPPCNRTTEPDQANPHRG